MSRFVEFINTASEKLATELISPEAIFYVPGRSEPMRGPAGDLSIIQMMRGGFPDIQWTLEEMVAEGDKVAASSATRPQSRHLTFKPCRYLLGCHSLGSRLQQLNLQAIGALALVLEICSVIGCPFFEPRDLRLQCLE